MDFFNSAVDVLQTLVIALGAGLGIWGGINLMEGYGNDREQGRGCRFPAPRPCSFFVLAWTIRKPFLRV